MIGIYWKTLCLYYCKQKFDVVLICNLEPCRFVAVEPSECPPGDLEECSSNMATNQLCEADFTLPDGNTNYDINNCDQYYDVFKFVSGLTAKH